MNKYIFSIWLGLAVFTLESGRAQLTQIPAGSLLPGAVTTDFEAFTPGAITGNEALFQAGNISSAALVGTFNPQGDILDSGTTGNALVSFNNVLTVAAPGDGLDDPIAGAGFLFNFVNPASQFGFSFVDQSNANVTVSAFSGASLIGSFMFSSSGGGFYYFQAGSLIDSFQVISARTGGWGLDNIVIAGFTIVSPATATNGSRPTPTYMVTNAGAIISANTSGLGMGLVNQQITQNAPNTALNDLNNRLFRARAGWDNPGALASNMGGDSSLLRYLAFVQDENMSYKVALGLADPEERTIEVNMVDTLSAQAGRNLNGQSMGGGLPYAMMGVPLMPVAGGAATVRVVEAAPSGKTVIDDSKAVIESEEWNRWELFAAGDFSFYDQDQLTDMMQGFDTDTYAGTVGLEYRIKKWLNLGLAWSYLQSDTNISGDYGNIDLEGNLISGYATAFWRQYWADILYSYGTFNNDLHRNTGLGSSVRGDTDSQSHNIRLNFGRNFNVGNNIVTGPIAGLRYSNGDIDPYSETGRSSAALDYDGTDFESMVSRLGWQASHVRSTTWGRLLSQVHLSWEHEYMPENGTVGVALQTSPFALVTGGNVSRFGGYSTESDGAHPGTDWLSAGAGLRFELANGVAFSTDYEGVFFRSNASQHYASAKLSYEWGAIMPSGGGGKSVSGKAVAYEAYDASPAPVAASPASPSEAEVAVVEKKKSSDDFASWLARKGR